MSNPQTNNIAIYGLHHPITNQIRYVGKSNDPNNRYKRHLIAKDNSYKSKWVRSLAKKGLQPVMKIIEWCNESNWAKQERYWITKIKYDWEQPLTNITLGGDGGNTWEGRKHSQESKDKIGLANKGKKHTSNIERNKRLKSKRVVQYSLDGKKIRLFSSVTNAAKVTGCSKTNIAKMANGSLYKNSNNVGGFIWKYA
jgi:hypothetical protein